MYIVTMPQRSVWTRSNTGWEVGLCIFGVLERSEDFGHDRQVGRQRPLLRRRLLPTQYHHSIDYSISSTVQMCYHYKVTSRVGLERL